MKLTREQILLSNAIGMLLDEADFGNDEANKYYLVKEIGITENELEELGYYDKGIDERFEILLREDIKNNNIKDDSFVVEYCSKMPLEAKEYCLNSNAGLYDIDEYIHAFDLFEDITFMNAIELCKVCYESYDVSGHEIVTINDLVDMFKTSRNFNG